MGMIYRVTGSRSKEAIGKVDNDGTAYRGSGRRCGRWEVIGTVDENGLIYRSTSKTPLGTVDENGVIYRGTEWPSLKQIGKVDNDGTVYRDTGQGKKEVVAKVEPPRTRASGAAYLLLFV